MDERSQHSDTVPFGIGGFVLPIKVEIRAKTQSVYDDSHIEDRLTYLRDEAPDCTTTREEILFLENLRIKRLAKAETAALEAAIQAKILAETSAAMNSLG